MAYGCHFSRNSSINCDSIICQTEVNKYRKFRNYYDSNGCSIQPRSILGSNRYVYIYIPIYNWQLTLTNFNDFLFYDHKAMDISILQLRSHTGNNNTVVCISTCSQVISHTHNISIIYVRHAYNWIKYMWIQHSRNY